MLEIKNLHVKLADEDKPILKGVSLQLPKGEVHAIMGPNGSGKSTLAYVLAGRDGYEVTEGEILWNGESILDMEPDERAAKGVFLAFQYPMEIPGVATMTFLRTAVNAVRKKRGQSEFTTPEFLKRIRVEAARLGMADEMLKRPVNVGFSGGEKKRMEILQMAMLEPSLCVLDETDSGLDIDAVRIVSEGVNALRSKERAMLVITHYQRLLNYIVPDKVHVMADGRIAADRRQGAGAGAGKDRLRRLQGQSPREGLRRDMTVAVSRTKAEQALTQQFEAVAARLPGDAAVARGAQGCHRHVRGARPAAPPHRGMEVHRPAQRAEGGAAAGGRGRRGGKPAGDRRGAGRPGRARRLSRSCSSTAGIRPELSAVAGAKGLEVGPLGAALPKSEGLVADQLAGAGGGRCAQHGLHDRRRAGARRRRRAAGQAVAAGVRPRRPAAEPGHHAQHRAHRRRRTRHRSSRRTSRCRTRRPARPTR